MEHLFPWFLHIQLLLRMRVLLIVLEKIKLLFLMAGLLHQIIILICCSVGVKEWPKEAGYISLFCFNDHIAQLTPQTRHWSLRCIFADTYASRALILNMIFSSRAFIILSIVFWSLLSHPDFGTARLGVVIVHTALIFRSFQHLRLWDALSLILYL